MNKWKYFRSLKLFMFLFVAPISLSYSQTLSLIGTVVDAVTHQPISRAIVGLLEIKQQTSTDENGHFHLTGLGQAGIRLPYATLLSQPLNIEYHSLLSTVIHLLSNCSRLLFLRRRLSFAAHVQRIISRILLILSLSSPTNV
jgi:hypothetical protein